MSNVRWSIVVRDNVDKSLSAYLGRRGTKTGASRQPYIGHRNCRYGRLSSVVSLK